MCGGAFGVWLSEGFFVGGGGGGSGTGTYPWMAPEVLLEEKDRQRAFNCQRCVEVGFGLDVG